MRINKSDIAVLIIIAIVFTGFVFIARDRFQKIDNGEITVVSQTEMAERR